MKLTQDDKGRHIKIWIRPDQDKIAVALGANIVEVSGKIVRVGEDFIEINVGNRTALPHMYRNILKRIPFSAIKKYELFAK